MTENHAGIYALITLAIIIIGVFVYYKIPSKQYIEPTPNYTYQKVVTPPQEPLPTVVHGKG